MHEFALLKRMMLGGGCLQAASTITGNPLSLLYWDSILCFGQICLDSLQHEGCNLRMSAEGHGQRCDVHSQEMLLTVSFSHHAKKVCFRKWHL